MPLPAGSVSGGSLQVLSVWFAVLALFPGPLGFPRKRPGWEGDPFCLRAWGGMQCDFRNLPESRTDIAVSPHLPGPVPSLAVGKPRSGPQSGVELCTWIFGGN